jgi:AraC-like DNA-binding protein
MENMKTINFDDFNLLNDIATYNYDNKIAVGEIMNRLPVEGLLPARASAFSFFIVEDGQIQIELDYTLHLFEKKSFFIILPEHLIKSINISDSFKAKVMLIDQQYFSSIGNNMSRIYQPEFINIRKSPGFKISDGEFVTISTSFDRIKEKAMQPYHLLKDEIIKGLLTVAILELDNVAMNYGYGSNVNKLTRQENILSNFLQLLQQYAKTEHQVIFYADKLHITSQYLALVLRRLTGKTTREWLANALIIEAKIFLKHTELSVQQVSDTLNFCDSSAFGKFFKNIVGVTPFQYRKNKEI